MGHPHRMFCYGRDQRDGNTLAFSAALRRGSKAAKAAAKAAKAAKA
jgi:hypothetical protein